MNKLLVTEKDNEIVSLLLEDGKAVRISRTPAEESRCFGDVYRARVQSINKGLSAAFVELGGGQTAYFNTGGRSLKPGMELTVQVSQEAFGTKLPTVSDRISLPGELLVLTDEPGGLAFSRRGEFSGERREAVNELLLPFMELNGFILRTAAENAPDEALRAEHVDFARTGTPEALRAEAESLTETYRRLLQKAEHSPAPAKIADGQPVWLEWLQGMDKTTLQEAVTDVPAVYEELTACFSRMKLPAEKLRLYADPALSLGQLYSLEKHLSEAAARKVWLDNGAYLIIEHTEAMTVIDVNSGKDEKDAKSAGAAETINREAAREIARQLLLRNLSGMIMIDFINMKQKGAESALLDYMRELTDADPVYVKVLDITSLGIMELTRRRIRRPYM